MAAHLPFIHRDLLFQNSSKRDSTKATLESSEEGTPAKMARMSARDDAL